MGRRILRKKVINFLRGVKAEKQKQGSVEATEREYEEKKKEVKTNKKPVGFRYSRRRKTHKSVGAGA